MTSQSRRWNFALKQIRLTTAPFPTRPQTVINTTKARSTQLEMSKISQNPAFKEPKTINYHTKPRKVDDYEISHRAYACYFQRKKEAALRFEESNWKNNQKLNSSQKVLSPLQKQTLTFSKPSLDPCGIEKVFQARKVARNEQGLEEGSAPIMRPKLKPEKYMKPQTPIRVFYWG